MGFYPPATLVRDAMRRAVAVRAVDVNRSAAGCAIEPDGAVRIGLGYVKGIGEDDARLVAAAREADGPFRDVADLARRVPLATDRLEAIVAAGGCDALGARREQLWRLGLIARPENVPAGRQLALPLELGDTPPLPAPSPWDLLVADYRATGLSVRPHPLAQLRPRLDAGGFVTTADLRELPTETSVRVAGLTVARQRPGSANGVVFLLIEDEHGMINVILFPAVYDRVRLLARTEPLLEVRGRLERRGRNLNVIAEQLLPLDQPDRPAVVPIPLRREGPPDEREIAPAVAAAGGGAIARLRGVAPGAHHFARGRH
jgi:error-prone DNA polymerase